MVNGKQIKTWNIQYIKRLIVVVSLFSLLFLGSSSQVLSLQGSSSILSQGTIVYPISVLRAHGTNKLTSEQKGDANLLATNLDMHITWYYLGEVVENIHEINPNVKCLLYRNMRAIYSYSSEWQMALNNGWLLRDSSGALIYQTAYPEVYMVDIVNQEYRDFIVQWLNNYFNLYGFDGVFADNCLFALATDFWGDCSALPINPRTGNLYTDEEAVNDLISFVNYVKTRIGNKLWVSNGIFQGRKFFSAERHDAYLRFLRESKIDGFMSEGLFTKWEPDTYYSEEKWKQSVDFVAWIQSNWLNQTGKIYLPHGRCSEDEIPAGSTPEQVATFIFCSLLLGINRTNNTYLSLQGAILLSSIQNLFKIDLGIPTNHYQNAEGTSIYYRDFTKVRVLVNPSDQQFTINLGANFTDLKGTTVSTIVVDPHIGVILKR